MLCAGQRIIDQRPAERLAEALAPRGVEKVVLARLQYGSAFNSICP